MRRSYDRRRYLLFSWMAEYGEGSIWIGAFCTKNNVQSISETSRTVAINNNQKKIKKISQKTPTTDDKSVVKKNIVDLWPTQIDTTIRLEFNV